MEINLMMKIFHKLLDGMVKKQINDKSIMKAIKKEYYAILKRAADIGGNNNLLSSYILCAYFISMNRSNDLSPEENLSILEKGMRNSKCLKLFLGDAKSYFSDKKMNHRKQWSIETHQKRYENDWVVDVLPKTKEYEFGFDYLECGVCKLCKDEGCPELAKYLCKLDFMLVELIGIKLDRTQTLADGGEKCDFRFKK